MTQPPPIPPYAQPEHRPLLGFFIGLVAGALVSFVLWGIAWHPIVDSPHGVAWLIAIPLLKFISAIALMFSARTRAAAVGLLISIGLGFLIFFGSCFAHINK